MYEHSSFSSRRRWHPLPPCRVHDYPRGEPPTTPDGRSSPLKFHAYRPSTLLSRTAASFYGLQPVDLAEPQRRARKEFVEIYREAVAAVGPGGGGGGGGDVDPDDGGQLLDFLRRAAALLDDYFFYGALTRPRPPVIGVELMCESDVESEEEYGGEDWGWGGGRPRSTFTGYCETLGPDEEDGGDEDRPRYVLHLNPRIGRRYDDEEENVEDESAAGKTLLTELVLTLVHEMIHAYLQAYACVGSECGCASNALEAVGASHHGPVFQGLQHAVGASLAGWPESGGLLGLLDGDSVRRFLRMDYEREAERAATAERFGSPAWSLALVQRPHEPPHCFAGVIVDLDGVAVDVEELHEACCPLVPLAERMTADAERGDAECSSSEAAVAGTDDDVADSEGTFAQRGCRWAWSTIGFFMGRFSSGGAGNNGDPGTECRMKLA